MSKLLSCLLVLCALVRLNAQTATANLHSDWTALLQKHVSNNGKVDYAGFKNDKSKLDAYIGKLRENMPQTAWTREQKIAYWVNLYNAFTIQKVSEKYPAINSIMELDGGKFWTTAKINLGGKDYTPDAIEKDILIKELKEPRVHFALNCAAASCPPLMNKAWEDRDLNNTLETRTREFLNNKNYNVITFTELRLSKIFEWYAGDFTNVISFVRKYSKTAFNLSPTIKYMEYDWKLNKK